MKPYFDAGLKVLAKAVGYPLVAIQSSSQFQKSHNFILGAWEAMYRVLLQCYMEGKDAQYTSTSSCLLCDITKYLQSPGEANLSQALIQQLLSFRKNFSKHFKEFQSFVQNLARTDDTCRFWIQFVFQGAMAYISLFLAFEVVTGI